MIQTLEISPFIAELTARQSDQLRQLFASAEHNTNLLSNDFLTVRDLLELTDSTDSESLWTLLLVMHMALDEGSLCVEASESGMARRLVDLVGEQQATEWSNHILADLKDDRYARLIGSSPDEEKPIILHHNGNQSFFYFQKYLRSELVLSEQLTKKLRSEPAPVNPDKLRRVLLEVLVERPLVVGGTPMQADLHQRLAVGLALLRNFVVVSGGPGTGKTSIVVTMLRCLVRSGIRPDRIALAAPTGRAAQRMTEAIRSSLQGLPDADVVEAGLDELSARTLHSLLQYRPRRGSFERHEENPIPADVIVVDEVSMVGLELMARLLKATRQETKIILLGDKDQLPSVDAGAVLAGLIPEKQLGFSSATRQQLSQILDHLDLPEPRGDSLFGDAVVVLQRNYRSQAHIREVASAVNQLDGTMLDRLPIFSQQTDADLPQERPVAHSFEELEAVGGCWWLPQTSIADFHEILEAWSLHQFLTPSGSERCYVDLVRQCTSLPFSSDTFEPHHVDLLDALFRRVSRCRLLTLIRESRWGCVDINSELDKRLRPKLDRGSRGTLFAGAPVLVTRNDHVRRLYNGDVGVTLKTERGGYRVVFARHGSYVSLPADALPPHELGFALTVHKSQGSEYRQVLVVLPLQGARSLLTKEIIYTAITRAKDLAILCGSEEVLQTAVSRRVLRESGMPWHAPASA